MQGLEQCTIRELARWYEELARWYEEEGYRRLGIGRDQAAVDRDLRQRLAEFGVFPEFIAIEFERVMQVVFPGSQPMKERTR